MLDKAYDPSKTEDRIYKMWEESGAFKPSEDESKEAFTVSMPLPNATGQLHLGHAVMLSLQDIFTRYQRMQGKAALWIPGTDHAAIATENVVIKKIQEEERIKDPREELGREEVLKRIISFVDKSQDTIRNQIRKMGSSCDWSREAYTMDEPRSRLVREVFCNMYNDGLIYRGHRIVNWDPKLKTNVSDEEVNWKEQKVPFYTLQYGPFQIGTVRPETKFGDKCVVVHPDDKRYKDFKHGDTFECEWINGPITATVIKDEAIDPEFGTGCMTITPWHTQVDFDIAERHGLDKEQVIDFDGKLLSIAQEFEGMSIVEARPKILAKLEKKGLLVKTEENYENKIATNSRGGGMIEPQIREQWFVDVNKKLDTWKGKWAGKSLSLKDVMFDVVRNDEVHIIPERFKKTYFHWIENLRDWCISRQIWWGHRIPVYYCSKCTETVDGKEVPMSFRNVSPEGTDIHEACGSPVHQDPDTLDTWFSSALWTWSTLIDHDATKDLSLSLEKMLEKSPDFQRFHPNQVLETGYDIIFFWVARMILMTTYNIGDLPFDTVYLHGMVRTRDGKKMSKSDPSTCIDPLEIIPKYGADALRMSMIVGQSPGNDFGLYEEKIAGYRNFINKLWNASRFVLMQCEAASLEPAEISNLKSQISNLSLADRAVLSALQQLIDDVSKGLDEYRLSEVGERLYSFTWDYFCDWYLELSKGEANPEVLVHVLRSIVTLLHPYCPFVTEELWASIKSKDAGMLISSDWVTSNAKLKDQSAQDELQTVIDVISAVRTLRSEQGIEPGKNVTVTLITQSHGELLEAQNEQIKRMAKVESLTIDTHPDAAKPENAVAVFMKDIEVHLSLDGLIDKDKELEKLTKEKQKLEGFIKGVNAKLGNEKFVANAKEKVVELERQKLATSEEKLQKVEERLKSLTQ
ncbi:MAG: valine--tRNA ligase [bacterium]|nr:valine--tRNA ligase [bacterium]